MSEVQCRSRKTRWLTLSRGLGKTHEARNIRLDYPDFPEDFFQREKKDAYDGYWYTFFSVPSIQEVVLKWVRRGGRRSLTLFPWAQAAARNVSMLPAGILLFLSPHSHPFTHIISLIRPAIPEMFFNGFKLFDRLAIMMLAMMNQQNTDLPSPSDIQGGLVRRPPQPVASRPPPPVAMQNQSLPLKFDHNRLTSNHTIRKPAANSSTEGQSPNPNGWRKKTKKPAENTTITTAINKIDSSGKSSNTSEVAAKREEIAGKVGRIKVQSLPEKAVNSSNR